MMKTDDFLAVNGFDPDTFLYAEEVILAERLKQINKQIYFLADVSVVHLGGSSTSNAMQNSKLKQILIESNSLYYRRYLQCNKLIIWLYKILNR